jgi:hypothetical protein
VIASKACPANGKQLLMFQCDGVFRGFLVQYDRSHGLRQKVSVPGIRRVANFGSRTSWLRYIDVYRSDVIESSLLHVGTARDNVSVTRRSGRQNISLRQRAGRRAAKERV